MNNKEYGSIEWFQSKYCANKGKIIDYFDYDNNPYQKRRLRLVASFSSAFIQSTFGRNVKGLLDLGCGPGHLSAQICSKIILSGPIIGIDFIKENIERADAHNVYTQLHNIDVLQYASHPGLAFDINITLMNDFLYYLSIEDQIRLVKLLDRNNFSSKSIYIVTTRFSPRLNYLNKKTPYPTLDALNSLFATIGYTLAKKKQWSSITYTFMFKILRKLRSLGVSSNFMDLFLLRLTCFVDEIIDKKRAQLYIEKIY